MGSFVRISPTESHALGPYSPTIGLGEPATYPRRRTMGERVEAARGAVGDVPSLAGRLPEGDPSTSGARR